jgi:hypothetical protein
VTLTCIDTLCVLILGVLLRTPRISCCTSGVIDLGHPLLATRGAKFQCSQRQQGILVNIFLSGHLFFLDTVLGTHDGQAQHYCLPNPYMKCILASSDLGMLSHQFSINTHLLYTSLKIWKLFKIVSDRYQNCLNIVNDKTSEGLTKFTLSFSDFRKP